MRNILSRSALALVALVYLLSAYAYKPYRAFYQQDGQGDAFGYYVYLPAFFIHHDLHDLYKTMAAKYSHSSPGRQPSGSYQNKYFAGTAVLQAPFFLAAHAMAGVLEQPADGFSMVYMYAVSLSCIFWACIGLLIVTWILRRYFPDSVVAAVVIILGLATNLYYLAVAHPPICHAYLFFWYALLVYATILFYESGRSRFVLLIGYACGMIIATRPNELYCIVIPVLWGIDSRAGIVARWTLIKSSFPYILAAGIIMFVCLLPQLLYWKTSVGKWIYYSYTDEKFDFLHPRIWDGLTSFSNGWLTYSPIMILSLAGIWPLIRQRHPARAALIVYVVIHVYVIYSWWCWFYMGSYGSRPMTEAYPLLGIPLAFSIDWLRRSWVRIAVTAVVLCFCIFQLMMQTYQMTRDIINTESGNWPFTVVTFGKTSFTYEEAIVKDTKEIQPSQVVLVKPVFFSDMEDSTLSGSDRSVASSGHRSVRVPLNSSFLIFKSTAGALGLKKGQWVKSGVMCLAKEYTTNTWHKSALVIWFTRHGHRNNKWRSVGLQDKIDNPEHKLYHFPINQWGYVYFYAQVPDDMQPDDEMQVYAEHKFGPDVYIDDAKIELYEGK